MTCSGYYTASPSYSTPPQQHHRLPTRVQNCDEAVIGRNGSSCQRQSIYTRPNELHLMDDVDRSGFGAANQGNRSLEDGPPIDRIETVFAVYEARQEDGQIVYYGDPLTHPERVVRELWPIFRERGYDADLERRHGEYAIVAEPTSVGIDGIPWTNIVLFLLAVGSTLFAARSGISSIRLPIRA